MNRKINIIGLTLFFTLTLFSFVFSQESMTITTYYPSPYGSYNELQLYPHSSPVTSCSSSTRGTMYYDSDDNQTKICDGSNWQTIGGTPSGAVMFFNLSSCPSGWSELTSARGRYVVGVPAGGTLAGTQGSALTNLQNRPIGREVNWCGGAGGGYPNYSDTQACGEPKWRGGEIAGAVPPTNAPYIQLLVCQKS